MIVWSDVAAETTAQREFSDDITITSFAVCKDEVSDWLISWPRVQNALFAVPPDVDLPHPGVLARLHVRSLKARATQGFELDVSNMFHQIVPPKWLSYLLLLAKVSFGDLAGSAQRATIRQIGLKRRPKQAALLRRISARCRWSSRGLCTWPTR